MFKKHWLFLLFCTLSLIIISIRYFFAINAEDYLKIYRDQEKSFELIGIVSDEPDVRADHIKYTVREAKSEEKILVSLPLYPEYFYKDRIKIYGRLQTPVEFPDFSYKDYLLKDGIRTVSYYPAAELIERKSWTFFGAVLKVKNKLAEVSQRVLPFPESELFSAMMLGRTGTLPQNLKDNFSKSGLSHIVAISGMNITIIVGILASVLGRTKLANFSFYLISIFLFLYILLVGLPPSAVRAGIMGAILIFASKVHRQYVAERSLILAAILMLLLNPLLLRYDIGFQLSFLAVLGILKTGKFTQKFFEKIFRAHLKWLSSILAMTFSAQVFTLPIMIYNFGILSLISPIANIFVVPFLPFIMVFGFFVFLAGLISTSVGIFVAFPLYLILTFTIWVAEFSAGLSFSFIEINF